MDFNVLKTQIIANDTLTDAELLTKLNAATIPEKQSISTGSILAYLHYRDIRLELNESVEPAAKKALIAFTDFPDAFDMSVITNVMTLAARLQDLVDTASLAFNQGDMDFILSMGDTTISLAKSLGLGNVTQGDIDAARSL